MTLPQKFSQWDLVRAIMGYIFAPLFIFGVLGLWLTRVFENKALVFILLGVAFFTTMGLFLANAEKIVKKIDKK
ncbi:MAG: hypothetical protein HYV32_04520 [Candidatus Kerfeldbacteria bacterium]|nr:hypothetical protein [Candidatus Kerfeldbacteria bacterium]